MSPIDQHLINLPVDTIRRSWERCATRGLRTDERLPDDPNARVRLSDRLEANARLVAYAQPIMEHLHQQIARSSSTILLADDSGVILRSVGDSDFLERAARVALKPGHCWSEHVMGTNAIGTALTEQRPVAVIGEEHFLDRNKFLTCIAAPIHAPTGGVLGILDISCSARLTQVHALALLQTTTEIIENRLIETLDDASVVLRFHHQPEALASPLEGLAVFNESGGMLACNRRAERLLGLPDTRHSQSAFNDIFETRWNVLLDHALRSSFRPTKLRCNRGREFAATVLVSNLRRVRPAGAVRDPRVLPRPRPRLTLEDMDLGDKAVGTAIRRARRILGLDIPLLIQGETGTGKEVFAQAIHCEQSGPARPFVAVNCASIPESLIESELFGYKPGAFTGASREGRRGKILQASGGTLFLDEIGDMPVMLQARLLRVLEEREVIPLGGETPVKVDIKLISATHRNLTDLVAEGRFREDLYYRLQGITLTLPPLRDRHDRRELIRHVLAQECAGQEEASLNDTALRALEAYPWPGNIRQLRNVLRTALALREGREITPGDLPEEIIRNAPAPAKPEAAAAEPPGLTALESAEREAILRNLEKCRWNVTLAARQLHISRNTLYRKMKHLNIRVEGEE